MRFLSSSLIRQTLLQPTFYIAADNIFYFFFSLIQKRDSDVRKIFICPLVKSWTHFMLICSRYAQHLMCTSIGSIIVICKCIRETCQCEKILALMKDLCFSWCQTTTIDETFFPWHKTVMEISYVIKTWK